MFQLPQNSDHLLCRELHKISHCSLDTAPSQLFAPCHLSFSASILFFAASHRLSFPPILLIASTFYYSVDTSTDPIPVSSPLTQLLAIHPIIHFSAASHRLSFPPILLIASTFYFSVDTGTDPIPVSSPLTQLLAIHPIIHFSLGVKIIIVINADLFAFFFNA